MRDIFESYKLFDIDPSKLRSRGFYKNFVIDEREKFWEQRKKLNKLTQDNCCFLCGNKKDNGLFLEYKGYQLFECRNCSLVFANVEVEDEYTETVYDNKNYEEMLKKEVLDTYEYRKNTFGNERLNYIESKCQFDRKNHSLLDLGCGPGYFLKYLQENGVRAKGVELTQYLVSLCQELGLDVERIHLEDMEDGSFNVITMFDVLEHLSEPVKFFQTAANKLKDGGHILMYTPNIHSFSFYFQQGKQNLLLPYEHLCFYDEKSLEYLAGLCGFTITSVEYHGLDIVDYLAMKEYEDNIEYNRLLKEIIPFIQALVDKNKLANHMRIVFKRTAEK